MAFLDVLMLGFSEALTPTNLLFCFIGALLGTLIGVLPGIGPTATVAILLPVTFFLPPLGALIMLAGIFYGAQYGGSTTAILVNLPGEASAVVTAIDGYQMARQGRAGAALAIAALGSFFAGTVATIALAIAGPTLSSFALSFGPAEYVSLCIFGLLAATILAHGSVIKAIGMVCLGLVLGMVGIDVNSGSARLTFGSTDLYDGIEFVVIAVGLFGVAEIATNLESTEARGILQSKIGRLWPTREEFKQSWGAILRGTGVGTILGVLPGGGATLSAFSAYSVEKRVSKTPEKFGHGAIAGVAGPEAANNAGAQSSFIPLLTLGIPSNSIMAMMLGAMTIHGITPGPSVIQNQPELFWGLVASMWLGNAMLLVINLPLIGLWVKLLSIPYRLMYPAILLFCCVGVYSVSNRGFDVALVILFGILGYILRKAKCEPGPLLLGFVLGPLLETNLRRAMLLSQGDWSVFFVHPISAVLLAITGLMLITLILPSIRQGRKEAFEASED
ncbi:tripartite tricarboxylate transporter permease [Agrobacterium vitis]|uniref:Tripartite tricarboxylate transporter permease n=1 Tax=Agrobacterium vitis TaxID=373 RepID=A0A120DBR0_AGRVI|nr:tripartite tricarboxylate transporter permease [Agrobacterium vitis]KAA3506510.1 tripartite tricarboxylate transporter permease [Agrobacterium vitis]KAA3520978.1 tripartite tricarboxylate transporter permease [Agrobacterium vitis]MCF1479795.1 tripartite tricarboxylate transporter permease [Agrobacterium vitis]MUO80822.1 tripartite tricarboxylate transporter permease [Agrobacterium vitis]MUO94730.1 tripartite tricarboxylate transporter permease [Agrobacterium vitis]